MATIVVTGAAGFIGMWTCEALLKQGHRVVGIDNFNSYYDVNLKRARAKRLAKKVKISEIDIANHDAVNAFFKSNPADKVVHLAGQAGVRYSLENPYIYEQSNSMGTLNILEACHRNNIKSLVLASSSSVYGGNTKIPFSVSDAVDTPVSLYAATKRYNELLAYTYHHLYGMHCTILRFFTVYGPWGRPDMAYFTFTKSILAGEEIPVYNKGNMKRDFTYVTDIVEGVCAAVEKDFEYEIFNLGNSQPVNLDNFVRTIEGALGKQAKRKMMPIQPGDVPETYANIELSRRKLGFAPKVKLEDGIREFVNWYKTYYRV